MRVCCRAKMFHQKVFGARYTNRGHAEWSSPRATQWWGWQLWQQSFTILQPPCTVVYRLPPHVTVASTNNNFNFAYRTLSVNSNFVTSLPQDDVRPKDRWLATVSTNSFRTRSIPNRPELPPGGKKLTIMTANQYHCQGSPRAWQHQPQSKSLYCNASIPLLPLPTIYHPVPPFQTLDTVEVKR